MVSLVMLVDTVAFIQVDKHTQKHTQTHIYTHRHRQTQTHTHKNNIWTYGNGKLTRTGCPYQLLLSWFYLPGNSKQWDTSKVSVIQFH